MSGDYVLGEPHPNTLDYATFETKPSPPDYTGGGYEHWRSNELRECTPGTRKEDVYVSHHRLLAVVACYPADEPLGAVIDDLAEKDVHHESGVPWDNRPENLSVVNHGQHSEITQTQRRAWAADAKREVERTEQQALNTPDTCGYPGCDADGIAESPGFDGVRCIPHAKAECDGETIQL